MCCVHTHTSDLESVSLVFAYIFKCVFIDLHSVVIITACLFLLHFSVFDCAPRPSFRLAASVSFLVLVMRKGGESSWSGPWHLGCTLEVFHVHSYQDQFIQPGWAECVFSLGLCFMCSFVLFDLFVCPHSFMFPWAVESSVLQFLALA